VIGVELLGVRSLHRSGRVSLDRHHAGHLYRRRSALPGGLGVKKAGGSEEGDVSPGSLFASGLIAAGGLMGWRRVLHSRDNMEQGDPIDCRIRLCNDWVSVLAFGRWRSRCITLRGSRAEVSPAAGCI